MKTIIHVNNHKIKSNKHKLIREPVLSVKTYKSNIYTSNVKVIVPGLGEVARVVYSPDKPLPCGATCWVETQYEIETDD